MQSRSMTNAHAHSVKWVEVLRKTYVYITYVYTNIIILVGEKCENVRNTLWEMNPLWELFTMWVMHMRDLNYTLWEMYCLRNVHYVINRSLKNVHFMINIHSAIFNLWEIFYVRSIHFVSNVLCEKMLREKCTLWEIFTLW